MKKVMTYMTLLMTSVGMFFFFNSSAQAVKLNIVNGKDTPGRTGYGSCSEAWRNGFCRYTGYRGTRITVIYYDGSSYQVLGRSIDVFPKQNTITPDTYYYDQHHNSKVSLNVPVGPSRKDEITVTKNPSLFNTNYFEKIGTPINESQFGGYVYAWLEGMPTFGENDDEQGYWEKVFLKDTIDASGKIVEDSIGNQLIKLATGNGSLQNGTSLSSKTAWNKTTQAANPDGDLSRIGYRILIEPLFVWRGQQGILHKDGTHTVKQTNNYYVMTPTEYASLVWNENSYTGAMQVNWYLFQTERMLTKFDDIGIAATIACTDWSGGNKCFASDVQFPGSGRKGHALKIIDISNVISPACDYDSGKGFPVGKPAGSSLTDEEKKCCDEQLEIIKEKYKLTSPQQCMLTSSSVTSYINCMNVYFKGVSSSEQLWEQEKKELMEFNQKYPACDNINCDFQELKLIEEDYYSCVEELDIIEWMNNILLCKDTTCEQKYKFELKVYKQDHILCDTDEWEKRIPTHECTPLISECDEDNPNHFPNPDNNNYDKNCCIYFEEKMKNEYKSQGLTEAEIQQKINDWFYEPGKEFRLNCLVSTCNLDDPKLTPECCETLMKEHPEKDNSYWVEKGCKIETNVPSGCTWTTYADELIEHLNAMATANCGVGNSSKLTSSDTTNWDCIFSSDDIRKGSKEEIFRDYYVRYNNPYCAVYCREDVTYDFPDGSMIVKAGNHFTVGETGYAPEWKNVKFSSTRECRTEGSTNDSNSHQINTDRFRKDWEFANQKVMYTWDEWKIAQYYVWSFNHARRVKRCGCCNPLSGCSGPCGTLYAGPTGVYTTASYFDEEPITYYVQATWCTASISTSAYGSMLSRNMVKNRDDHRDWKHRMTTIEEDIHACTQWNLFYQYHYVSLDFNNIKATRYAKYGSYEDMVNYYEFNPDLTIHYDEPVHNAYDYTDLLQKHIKDTEVNSNFSTTGDRYTIKYKCVDQCGDSKDLYNDGWDNSLSKCVPKLLQNAKDPDLESCEKVVIFDYSPQSETNATYYKEINYTLKDGVFNTILKPQGTAVHGSEVGSNSKQIYIDLGYSALHVHFMTPTGRYSSDLTYPGFTPHATTTSQFDHNFDQFVKPYLYDCTYQVHNEIIENNDPNCVGDNCEPCAGSNCKPCAGENCSPASLRGLNLIYRPISLENPFPGIEGNGREPGSNWNDQTLINRFIKQNRGVDADEIYFDKYPMYQVTLTPALIHKIRQYNETTTYNDFNMDCLSDGTECKSEFLRGTISNTSYDFSNNFKTCKNSVGATAVCCGIGNWYDCDDKDGVARRPSK